MNLPEYLNSTRPPRITRTQAIRLRCLDCVGNNQADVRKCTEKTCPLWRNRLGREDKNATGKRLTRARAIRADCLDCCGGSANEVRLCPAQKCPTWPFRFGHGYLAPEKTAFSKMRRWDASWTPRGSPGRVKAKARILDAEKAEKAAFLDNPSRATNRNLGGQQDENARTGKQAP